MPGISTAVKSIHWVGPQRCHERLQRTSITEIVANDLILLEYVNKEYGGEMNHFSDWADEDQPQAIRYDPPATLDNVTDWRLKHQEH
jgi:hypothetical protein